jgi:hypothetical protein
MSARCSGTFEDVKVTLFHVLNPMPRELMEHGGSENPETEHHLGEQLRKDQEEWIRAEGAIEYPILVTAMERLGQTGFPLDHVTLKLGHERDIADSIMDEARAGGYGTVVVTRRADGNQATLQQPHHRPPGAGPLRSRALGPGIIL